MIGIALSDQPGDAKRMHPVDRRTRAEGLPRTGPQAGSIDKHRKSFRVAGGEPGRWGGGGVGKVDRDTGIRQTIEYLIGHFEYLKFEGSSLFIENYPGYRTKKKDPGKAFMADLREKLEALGVTLLYEPKDKPVPMD